MKNRKNRHDIYRDNMFDNKETLYDDDTFDPVDDIMYDENTYEIKSTAKKEKPQVTACGFAFKNSEDWSLFKNGLSK